MNGADTGPATELIGGQLAAVRRAGESHLRLAAATYSFGRPRARLAWHRATHPTHEEHHDD